MAEVDPLILEIRADLARYRAELQSSTALTTSQLGRQEKAVKSLETQFQRSSGAIGSSLKGLAATFAGAFTAKQLQGVLDDFTRLQNSLRVAGLEGEALAGVQSKLLGLSTRYGVSINELANLYGKSSQAASDLGASEEQLLQLTEASAQALKITGTSADQAQGALLGLTQALASGTVRAEEFNQINEGGLRPLLQVAANTERFGGSVAKLRQAVVDGKVSSQEFYTAILAGSEELDAKASKATLTLAGAFEALSSRLTVYMGEASAANGVTAALSSAIGKLADNLDTVIPAIVVITGALGVKYVSGVIAAQRATILLAATATGTAAGMGALGAATFAVQARMAGAATTTEALAFAMRGLGMTLPILAVSALVLGIGYLISESNDATRSLDALTNAATDAEAEADAMEARLRAAGVALDDVAGSGKNAAGGIDATSRAAAQAKSQLKALEDQAGMTALKLNLLKLTQAQGEKSAIQARLATSNAATRRGKFSGFTQSPISKAARAEDQAAVSALDREIDARKRQRDLLIAGIKSGVNVSAPAPARVSNSVDGSDSKKDRGGRKGRSGPSAAETEQRFYDELANLAQRTISAQSSIAASAEEKAELELRSIELAKTRAIEGINSEKNYTDAQKKRLLQQIDALAFEEQAVVEYRKTQQLEQEKRDLANQEYEAQSEALKYQFDLADSQAERRRLALDMIDLDYRHKEALLQAVIASEAISDAERERARLALTNLQAARARDTNNANSDTMGPAERYLDELRRGGKPEVIAESAQQAAVDGLQSLNDQLVDAIMNSKNLGQAFSNVAKQIVADLLRIAIQRALIEPLANALFGGSGGAAPTGGGLGGFFGSVLGSIGSIFGRASGGRVDAGTMYRVNEANQEFFRPDVAGQVIPLSKMRAQSGGAAVGQPAVIKIYADEGAAFVPRVEAISGQVAVETVRIAAPTIRDSAVQETFRRGSRPGFR